MGGQQPNKGLGSHQAALHVPAQVGAPHAPLPVPPPFTHTCSHACSRLPCRCRSSTYHKLASRLQGLAAQLCGGRLVFLLEGGYHTEAVGESVCEVFLALLGRPSVEAEAEVELPQPELWAETEALVAQLRLIHGL